MTGTSKWAALAILLLLFTGGFFTYSAVLTSIKGAEQRVRALEKAYIEARYLPPGSSVTFKECRIVETIVQTSPCRSSSARSRSKVVTQIDLAEVSSISILSTGEKSILSFEFNDKLANVHSQILSAFEAARREFGPSLHSEFQTPDELQNWAETQNTAELAKIKQSDEGGRFMHALATYRIVLVHDTPARKQNPFGQWVTLATLERLVLQSGTTNNELRTLVSLILSDKFDITCQKL